MKRMTAVFLSILMLVSCARFARQSAIQGIEAFEDQRYKKAVKLLEKAQKRGYDEPELHFYLGATYLVMGEYEKAILELEPIAGVSPIGAFMLGNAYYNLDKYDKAAEAYRNAISQDRFYLEAIEALAMMYPDGGVTREEALEMWKRALEMEKRDEWITRAKHYIKKLEAAK